MVSPSLMPPSSFHATPILMASTTMYTPTPVSAALRTMRGMQRSRRPSLKRAITKYEQAIKREVHESRASRVDARAVRDDRPDWSMPTHDASASSGTTQLDGHCCM